MSTSVGYIGGTTPSPTYREVCDQPNGEGHTEAIRIEFDASIISFEALMNRFFEEATPNIRRMQYRSAVWAQNESQAAIAMRVARAHGKADGVPVLAAAVWHDAEDTHQKYYETMCGGGERVCRRL